MRTLTLTLAAACLCANAFAADTLRGHITQVNSQVYKAIKKRDAAAFRKALEGHVTSDFTATENGKTMSFNEMCDQMKQGFAMMKSVTSVNSTILSLKEKGNSATGMTRHSMAGTMMGPDKKTHKMTWSGVSTDTYRKENGKWKMAKMVWGKDKMTMDGKPFDPTKMEKGG